MISRWLTYCRFLFALLIIWTATPVNFWHECEHQEHVTTESNSSEFHETCFVCDFEFPPAIQQSETLIPQAIVFHYPKQDIVIQKAFSASPVLRLNKAPPVV